MQAASTAVAWAIVTTLFLAAHASATISSCTTTDGSGLSSSYPCTCGSTTCSAGNDICNASSSTCPPGLAPVRLVDGNAPLSGRVEVYHNGQWGTVCDHSFTSIDARAVCRNLGFADGIETTAFGQGTGQIWLDEVGCTGSQSGLSDCSHNGWGVHDCGHSEDIGVECLAGCDTTNGSGPSSIYPCGCGSTICTQDRTCNADSDMCILNVSCLQYRFTPTKLREDDGHRVQLAEFQFANMGGTLVIDAVENPGGNNPSTERPENVADGSASSKWLDRNRGALIFEFCNHDGPPTAFRLTTANDSPGRDPVQWTLEVAANRIWLPVHTQSSDFPIPTTRFTTTEWISLVATTDDTAAANATNATPSATTDAQCTMTDGSGLSSFYPCTCGSTTCTAGNDICDASSSTCTPGLSLVRLVDGNSTRNGRVEVYYNGQWGTVCDDSFTSIDARVACRQLGFADGIEMGSAAFGQGTGQIWLDEVSCTGSESGLSDCSHTGWGVHNCGHSEDVGVECLANCDGTDGSGPSSIYPCGCGSNICTQHRTCNADSGMCILAANCLQYRFTPLKLREDNGHRVQLAEFEFANMGGTLVIDAVENPFGNNPPSEGPENVADGSPSTKWLDRNRGALIMDLCNHDGPPTAFRFTTANDSPERDPVQWTVEVAAHGTWLPVHVQSSDFATPTDRFTSTEWISLLVTGTDTAAANATTTDAATTPSQILSPSPSASPSPSTPASPSSSLSPSPTPRPSAAPTLAPTAAPTAAASSSTVAHEDLDASAGTGACLPSTVAALVLMLAVTGALA